MTLEAIGLTEKDKEFDVLHLEHTLQRNRDQKGSRDVLLPEQSGMKGETLKWVVDHGGKGGPRDQRLAWGWEWLCG